MSQAGWEGTAEVGLQQKWGALFASGWARPGAGGVGIGARW